MKVPFALISRMHKNSLSPVKGIRKYIGCFMLALCCVNSSGQETDSVIRQFSQYIYAINNFSGSIPQEKVYLHLDNTSYYQGDHIWFKAYVVTSELNRASLLSKTLYVELLNPGGEIVDKKILKIENGQCHGDFTLSHLPFYSGFYEIRAYTKYMLNFGEDIIFSRSIPVFNTPEQEGDFEEKKMQRYGTGKYPIKRKKPQKEKRVNLKFYPEGGYLVKGVESQMAFEATDATGHPIEITGAIINESKEEISRFSVFHEGRGVFSYLPTGEKHKAIIDHKGRKYTFDMPQALPEGTVLKVDNLSSADSLEISLSKNGSMAGDILGLAVFGRDRLYHFFVIDSSEDNIRIKIDKTRLPAGVSRVVLFNKEGQLLSDRLFFTHKNSFLTIKARTEKEIYQPYERVDMEFSLADPENNPVPAKFSLAIRDGMNEVSSSHHILADLLLMSEIKGYVRNPDYYFESDDPTHRVALDLLLMVQGWRRYSWEHMAGVRPFDLKYHPEQGIETHGQVVSFVRKIPKPDVQVNFFLQKRGEEDDSGSFADAFITDSLGRFSFVSDLEGKWNMILAVTEKGKKKDHRIILDRLFSPEPRAYNYTELQVTIAEKEEEDSEEETDDIPEENIESIFAAYTDSLNKAGINERIHRLNEVTVTAKKRSRERDIYNNRSKSIAYYDVHSEIDDIKDSGEYIGDDIHALLISINKNFMYRGPGRDYLSYKGKLPLFVINYEKTQHDELNYNRYKLIRLEAIKSIYINETLSIMTQYADSRFSPMDVDNVYSCAVFIETYPDGMIPTKAGKGVRKTWMEGYSPVKEFYSPDYTLLPPEPDYRRTLYWNPSVATDPEGKARIQFYNNSQAHNFKISAETVTKNGMIGIYKD